MTNQKRFSLLKSAKSETEFFDMMVRLLKEALYEKNVFVKNSNNQESRDSFFNSLRRIVEQIYSEMDGKSTVNEDIVFLSEGHTSLVFRVGDNVLKISKTAYPDSKTLSFSGVIPVFLNKSFQISPGECYIVSLSPLVETMGISEEELYGAYKNLRRLGYIWNDPKLDNVGRVIKDFEYNGIFYKKGDVVIIDGEDFAYVGETITSDILDEIGISSYNPKTYIFETKYLDEQGITL